MSRNLMDQSTEKKKTEAKNIKTEAKNIKTEKECIDFLIKTDNIKYLKYIPKHLVTEEICSIAFDQNIYSIYYIPTHLRTKQMCLEAVKKGNFLNGVPKHIMTEEMCLIGIEHGKTNACMNSCLSTVPKKFQTEKVCLAAFYINNYSLNDIIDCKMKEKIIKTIFEKDPNSFLKYISNLVRIQKRDAKCDCTCYCDTDDDYSDDDEDDYSDDDEDDE